MRAYFAIILVSVFAVIFTIGPSASLLMDGEVISWIDLEDSDESEKKETEIEEEEQIKLRLDDKLLVDLYTTLSKHTLTVYEVSNSSLVFVEVPTPPPDVEVV